MMLRIALFTLGVTILLLVSWDIIRRKRHQANWGDANLKLKKNKINSKGFWSNKKRPDFSVPGRKLDLEQMLSEPENEAILRYQPLEEDPLFVQPAPKQNDTQKPESSTVTEDLDLIIIHVVARQSESFYGPRLLDAFKSAQLEMGEKKIFHRYSAYKEQRQILFHVVQMKEPGYFNLSEMNTRYYNGVTLFFLIDKVVDPMLALDQMVKVAKQLSFQLHGELLDHKRAPLTLPMIDKYKQKIKDYLSVIV